jgi:hypothetical protein
MIDFRSSEPVLAVQRSQFSRCPKIPPPKPDHSIAILKRDYREVVTKADAEAYFDVTV